ncbi:hypothetical protein DMH27_05965 [Raoultella planticola]|nr:hypothetical protein [Raoultella planticola]
MQYMLTGLLILIISGLLLNAVSLVLESVYKMLKEMHLKNGIFKNVARQPGCRKNASQTRLI